MAGARVFPIASFTSAAVAGIWKSGVSVASRIRSMSSGSRPATAIARSAATAPIEAVVSSGPATRRSRIPVRVTIHSSDVSTICSRSALVRTRSGA